MKRAAALALAAALLGCARVHPAATLAAGGRAPSYAAGFELRLAGKDGVVRLRGVLAVGAGGRLRAEIGSPSVTSPLIVVADPHEISALSTARHLFYRGPDGADALGSLLGIALRTSDIAFLLIGERVDPPIGCTGSVYRMAPAPPGILVPTRLTLRCETGSLRMKLRDLRSIPGVAGVDPLALLTQPPGYETVDLDTFARALRPAS